MAKLIDITGKPFSGEWGTDDEIGNGIPVLRTTNFTNKGVVDYSDVVMRCIGKKNIEDKYLQYGDIILEKSGGSDKQPVGRVVFFDGAEHKYLFNNFTGLLRIKDKNKWVPKFVFYSLFASYLRGETRNFENKTTGLHNLKIDLYMSNIEVNDFPYAKQMDVVKKIDKLNFLIELKEKQIEKLDLLVKSRFIEMFGDPDVNELGWNEEKLGNCLGVIGGYAFKSSNFKENGVPILRIGNINTGSFRSTNLVYWENDITLNRYKIYPGDLVMSLTGTVGKADYGNVCILGDDYPVYYLNQRNAKLELGENLDKMYLAELLKWPKIKNRLTGISRGIRQANISNKDIEVLNVPIPPIALQNQFADFLAHINKSKLAIQQSLEKLETLKKSLMQEYFG